MIHLYIQLYPSHCCSKSIYLLHHFALKAKKVRYFRIAEIFEETARNEKEHKARYLVLLKNLEGCYRL